MSKIHTTKKFGQDTENVTWEAPGLRGSCFMLPVGPSEAASGPAGADSLAEFQMDKALW